MSDELSGQVAFVTAAAGLGVGRAVAERFAAAGAHVVVTDAHERRTAKVSLELGAAYPGVRVVGIPLDVGDTDAIDKVVAEVSDEFGRIDILVNNAAINWPGPIWDYPLAKFDATLAVNLRGPWYLSRQIMPIMRSGGGGAIINISTPAVSNGGGFGEEPVYAISKGALETMTRALAWDGGPHDIRVNTVSVGIVADSKFMADHPDQLDKAQSMLALPRHLKAAEVAEAALFLASAKRSGSITGDIVSVNAGAIMRL